MDRSQVLYYCNKNVYLFSLRKQFIQWSSYLCAELRIFFAEVDFREIEGVGAITASIIKEGVLVSDLYMNIIPLTYESFDAAGIALDENRRRERPDPAECKWKEWNQIEANIVPLWTVCK